MPRDAGLETILAADLAGTPGLRTQPMFGGLVWMVEDRLLCGARAHRMLLRLGDPDQEAAALRHPGVERMNSAGRLRPGWLWLAPEVYGDDALRRRLLAEALTYLRSLPPQAVPSARRAGSRAAGRANRPPNS